VGESVIAAPFEADFAEAIPASGIDEIEIGTALADYKYSKQ
jgi:hypothetical protein